MKRALVVCVFFYLSISFFVQGQAICNQVDFRLSQTKGCAPLNITIDNSILSTTIAGCSEIIIYTASGANPMQYTRNFTVLSPIIFSNPGVYKIGVTARCTSLTGTNCNIGGNTFATQTVTVLSTPPAQIVATGCANRTAFVQTDPNFYDSYTIDWGDGTNTIVGRGTTIRHQYSTSGTKAIFINYRYNYTVDGLPTVFTCNGSNTEITRDVQVYDNLDQPTISKLLVNGFGSTASGILTVNTNPQFDYRVYEKQGLTGTLTPIDTITNGDNVITIGNVAPQKCYQIESFDNCGNSAFSGVDVCALTTLATPNGSGNVVQFETHPTASAATYYVSVDGVGFYTLNTTTGVYFSNGTTQDANVECQRIYCYRHTAVFGATQIESVSAPVCIEGLKPSTFTGVADLNSSFENGRVVLTWTPASISGVTYVSYVYDRIGNTTRADSTQSSSLNPSNQSAPCYGISQKDKCGTGPPRQTCPMRLTGQKDNLVQNSMTSTDYTNGDNTGVIEYVIEMYTDNGTLIETRPLGGPAFIHNPINEQHQKVRYRIRATVPLSTGGTKDVYSNVIEIKQDLRLWVPNAFTPNGDNNNDTWYPKGLFFDKYNVQVYNRWGQLVYSSTDPSKQWDGGEFNPGVYHYFIEVETKYGDKMSDKGILNLVR